MKITAVAQLLFCFVVAVNGQLTVTTLPDILFLNNNGVHTVAPQSVIWLYCTADSATATPSITWTKDGVTLVNNPPHIRIKSSNNTLLSTTSSLVVDNFGIADDDGSYVCQASDGTATRNSSTLSLTAFGSGTNTLIVVTDPVSYDNDVFPVDNRTAVALGSTVGAGTQMSPLLRCVGGHVGDTGLGSFSPPSVVWVRNGQQVVADSGITITESTTLGGRRRASDLQITNFGLSDAGVYQCIFTDVDSDAEVITTKPLRLDTGPNTLEMISPQFIVINPPEKLVIETRASGGYQHYDWSRNGDPVTTRSFPATVAEFSNFFEIFVREPTDEDDMGEYVADLTIAPGQTQIPQLDFIVTVYSEPMTMSQTGDVTVLEGDSVSIACFSTGNPVPTITWYLGTSVSPFPQSDTVNELQADVPERGTFTSTDGNITSVLMIENAVYPAHEGEYRCVGLNSNRAGTNTHDATITVQVQGKY